MTRISHSMAARGDEDVSPRWNSRSAPRAGAAATRELIRSAVLRDLGRDERLVLVLWYAEGMSPEEIATTLGTAPHRVRAMHDDAVARIRELTAG